MTTEFNTIECVEVIKDGVKIGEIKQFKENGWKFFRFYHVNGTVGEKFEVLEYCKRWVRKNY